ncbi:MAG: hypothetical protein ABJB11_14855 [Ferruginibacter sp.]
MKKFITILSISVLAFSCSDQKTETTATPEAAKASAPLPYTAAYSSDFEMGNPAYVATILQGSWKDWETNNMDNMKSWVADTIVAFHSDNTMIQGADSLIALWKRGRAEYVSVIDSVDAAMAVYSKDKNENWVLVWAREINQKADGKKDTMALMETWRINKDGKADMLLQFDRAKRKK